MHHLSNLPPGCTDRAIEAQTDSEGTDTDIPFCAEGEAYCHRTDEHKHCLECGADPGTAGERCYTCAWEVGD